MKPKDKKADITPSKLTGHHLVIHLIDLEISKVAPGHKVDRKAITRVVVKESGMEAKAKDIKTLVGVICRFRTDVEMRKGKEGGTYKL